MKSFSYKEIYLLFFLVSCPKRIRLTCGCDKCVKRLSGMGRKGALGHVLQSKNILFLYLAGAFTF